MHYCFGYRTVLTVSSTVLKANSYEIYIDFFFSRKACKIVLKGFRWFNVSLVLSKADLEALFGTFTIES
jgi:hypothetical protein